VISRVVVLYSREMRKKDIMNAVLPDLFPRKIVERAFIRVEIVDAGSFFPPERPEEWDNYCACVVVECLEKNRRAWAAGRVPCRPDLSAHEVERIGRLRDSVRVIRPLESRVDEPERCGASGLDRRLADRPSLEVRAGELAMLKAVGQLKV